MATLYRVKDWAKHYECADSRKVDGPLKWLPVPTSTDGFAFGALALEKDKSDLLAAWHLILGVAARKPREDRGELSRDGRPLTADDLEIITRFPAKVFARAFEFFSSERIGWLTAERDGASADDSTPPTSSGANPDTSGPAPVTGHYITGQDRTEQELGAAVAAPAALSDAQWLESLKVGAAYAGIDMEAERAKCEIWCANNSRKFSRKRFVNWLNRIERPMQAKQSSRFGNLF